MPDVEVVGECSGAEAAADGRAHAPGPPLPRHPDAGGRRLRRARGDRRRRRCRRSSSSPPTTSTRCAPSRSHALDYLLKPVRRRALRRRRWARQEQARGRRQGDIDERLRAAREPHGACAPLPRARRATSTVFVERRRHRLDRGRRLLRRPARRRRQAHLLRETHDRARDAASTPSASSASTAPRSSTSTRVREIHPLFRGDSALVLPDGTQLRLSRARKEEFERRLAK